MRLIDADKIGERSKQLMERGCSLIEYAASIVNEISKAPTVEAVEVETVSEKIIRKKAEVSDYWMDDVKRYRATQGYSDIEHDVDNFLRGYNEAVEDMLAILYGERKDGVNGDG